MYKFSFLILPSLAMIAFSSCTAGVSAPCNYAPYFPVTPLVQQSPPCYIPAIPPQQQQMFYLYQPAPTIQPIPQTPVPQCIPIPQAPVPQIQYQMPPVEICEELEYETFYYQPKPRKPKPRRHSYKVSAPTTYVEEDDYCPTVDEWIIYRVRQSD